MLSLAYYLHCLLTVAAAACFADLLVRDGMLLASLQARAREAHKRHWVRQLMKGEHGGEEYMVEQAQQAADAYYHFRFELDNKWWWKPLWGCATCVSGQWAFWAYLCHYHGPAYCFPEHVYFVALALFFSLFLQWLIRRLIS